MSRLSIIGTPIGNLEDITLRALRTLSECDILICEDTRVTKGLLFHYKIASKPLWSYDEHSHNSVEPKVIESLVSGKHVAFVSDAGMPGVSDPGTYLIACIRTKLPDTTIEVIGGPSAITNAIAWSGLDTSHGFQFVGFIPHKKGRETLFQTIVTILQREKYVYPIVAYESSHRIEKTAAWFVEHAPDIRITVCREMTKLHEELVSGTPTEIVNYLSQPHKTKGEFVMLFTCK